MPQAVECAPLPNGGERSATGGRFSNAACCCDTNNGKACFVKGPTLAALKNPK